MTNAIAGQKATGLTCTEHLPKDDLQYARRGKGNTDAAGSGSKGERRPRYGLRHRRKRANSRPTPPRLRVTLCMGDDVTRNVLNAIDLAIVLSAQHQHRGFRAVVLRDYVARHEPTLTRLDGRVLLLRPPTHAVRRVH